MKLDKEISAEMLLDLLYPQLAEKWIVHNSGSFYRNYNSDAMTIEIDTADVYLARDGFMKLLPQSVLSYDGELRGKNAKERNEQLKRRQRLLNEAFIPLDTIAFRRRLVIERKTSAILRSKLSFLLKEYFGFDMEAETNYYVRECAALLPYISRYRGDIYFIKNLLKNLFKCEVELIQRRWTCEDSADSWLPLIRYNLIIPELDKKSYSEFMEQLRPFVDFLSEWMFPLEAKCVVRPIFHGLRPTPGQGPVHLLDYNVELAK